MSKINPVGFPPKAPLPAGAPAAGATTSVAGISLLESAAPTSPPPGDVRVDRRRAVSLSARRHLSRVCGQRNHGPRK
jgi:hypothetical protein